MAGETLEGQHHVRDVGDVQHGEQQNHGEGVAGLVAVLPAHFLDERKRNEHGGGHGQHGGQSAHGDAEHEHEHPRPSDHHGNADDAPGHIFGNAGRVDDARHHAEKEQKQIGVVAERASEHGIHGLRQRHAEHDKTHEGRPDHVDEEPSVKDSKKDADNRKTVCSHSRRRRNKPKSHHDENHNRKIDIEFRFILCQCKTHVLPPSH